MLDFVTGTGRGGGIGTNQMSFHNVPIVGPIFGNPNEAAKLQGMREAGQVYGAQRPQIAQARLNAMANQMAAFGPLGNAMALMYGPGGAPDPQMMLRNPYTGAPPPSTGGQPGPGAPSMSSISPGMLGGMSHEGNTFRTPTVDPFSNALNIVAERGGLGVGPSRPMPPSGSFNSTVRNSHVDPRSAEAHGRQAGSMDAVNRATAAANSGRAAGAAQGPPGAQMDSVRADMERRRARAAAAMGQASGGGKFANFYG